MNVIMYTKTGCPWAKAVADYLTKANIDFEERDILKNKEFADEVVRKTRQSKSPTLDIDGHYLVDADVKEVAAFFEKQRT